MFLAQGSRPARSPIGELPRTVPWGSQDAIENGPVTDWTAGLTEVKSADVQ